MSVLLFLPLSLFPAVLTTGNSWIVCVHEADLCTYEFSSPLLYRTHTASQAGLYGRAHGCHRLCSSSCCALV